MLAFRRQRDGVAGVVHVGLRHQHRGLAAGDPALYPAALVTPSGPAQPMGTDEPFRDHETGVMPRLPVLVARVAQADDQELDA